ncbi:MAG TPA: DUF6230 family protein [Nocardioidaceae bacterium]|nr:DUF6230 family protein [Nocardioidaceae bacterium]
MGRTRLGRLAAVTVPATAMSLGFGYAIVQGAVTAQLSAANPFEVTATSATADGLELSLQGATAATSNTSTTPATKKAAKVTLINGKVTNMCLAANQANIPVLGSLGLTISATGEVPLGTTTLNADSVSSSGAAVLGHTSIGVAESELDNQAAQSTNPGGFGMESDEPLSLAGLNAKAYALELGGLTLADGLSIAPVIGTASCTP